MIAGSIWHHSFSYDSEFRYSSNALNIQSEARRDEKKVDFVHFLIDEIFCDRRSHQQPCILKERSFIEISINSITFHLCNSIKALAVDLLDVFPPPLIRSLGLWRGCGGSSRAHCNGGTLKTSHSGYITVLFWEQSSFKDL